MEIGAEILNAKVMHKRFFPRVNAFNYGVYYLALPLEKLSEIGDGWRFGVNRPALLSFYDKDHGDKNGQPCEAWAREILAAHGANEITDRITLIAMPRVLGYVFNPVSFWMCYDRDNQLRAVICEVNNTFGEAHNYVCVKPGCAVIESDDWLRAEKIFHVSPFIERTGHYQFRFAPRGDQLGIWIDYYDENGEKQLITSLAGKLSPLTRTSLRRAFWAHPLITVTTIFLIHWQAIKLVRKGIRYIIKPEQLPGVTTATKTTNDV